MAYQYFLKDAAVSTIQDINKIVTITQPIKVEQLGGIKQVKTFTNIYQDDDLKILFKKMQECFSMSGVKANISLILHSGLHVVEVTYDPINDQWRYLDPNRMPAQLITGNDWGVMANLVKTGFPSPFDYNKLSNNTIFSTEIYCLGTHFDLINQRMAILETDEDWKKNQSLEGKQDLKDVNGINLLYMAAYKNDVTLMTYLLKNGVDVNITSNFGVTPLYLAVQNDFIDIVDLLLNQENINPNLPYEDGNTPLHVAVSFGNTELVKKLLANKNIEPKSLNKSNIDPLGMVRNEDKDKMTALFSQWKKSQPPTKKKCKCSRY